MRLLTTKHFERDLKLAKRRGKDISKLRKVTGLLLKGGKLPPRTRAHPLTGNWRGFWECHLEPDWLSIWKQDEDALTLARTGSHSDLF